MDYCFKIDLYGGSPGVGTYNSKTYFTVLMNDPRILEIEKDLT